MLSTEDRFAIQNLYARYCACFDLGDAEGWVNCFAKDGIFKSAKDMQGPEQLREFVEGRIKVRPDGPNRNVQHWNANLIVEGDGNKAKGLCYIMLVGQSAADKQQVFPVQGTYADDLVKVDGEWKFAVRQMFRDLPPASVIPRR